MRRALTIAALIAGFSGVSSTPSVAAQDQALEQMTPEQIKAGIENQHPAAYYMLAKKLFASGARDEAVFWFYAGQLRYRFHLAANPTLPRDGDPALFASLSEVVGRPLNEYAFGDVPALVRTLDDVLAWDEKTKNGFTSKTEHATRWSELRKGLAEMRDQVRANADAIRAQRKQNGLENRAIR